MTRRRKKCSECGKSFAADRSKKTCSKECSNALSRRAMQEWRERNPEKVKAHLEKLAKNYHANREFYRAQGRAWYRANRKRPNPFCVICGNEFKRHGSTQTVCSRACANKRKNLRVAQKRPPCIRLCVVCKHPYKKERTAKTCSIECSRIRKLQLQYSDKNIEKRKASSLRYSHKVRDMVFVLRAEMPELIKEFEL